MLSIETINTAPVDDVAAALGGVFENAPWIARMALESRPFASVDALHQAMVAVARAAPDDLRLEFLRGHPDLAGSSVPIAAMTADSRAEQAGIGLDRLGDHEQRVFDELNRAYRARFGFPFIIAARNHDRDSILAAFRRRLHNDADREMANALDEIAAITLGRLHKIAADG